VNHYLCATCGVQFDAGAGPPARCPVCSDERQYVGRDGQRWTTMEALSRSHLPRIETDAGLLGIGINPAFAIDQRALVLNARGIRVMWEATSLVTPAAARTILAGGTVDLIAVSHPHFHSAMVEWSEALGGVPILLHGADAEWIARRSRHVELWHGARLDLGGGLQLIHVGGHFPGSTVLHWRDGPRGGGALFPGDALQVTLDCRHVSFMYSYPNLIPLAPHAVRQIAERLAEVNFDDVYGFTWGRNIIGGGRRAVDRSLTRYLAAVSPDSPQIGRVA
jgi:DNA-directed RNA polymerase subunit RPC12/RpoP